MKRGREKGEKIMMETKLVLLGTGTPNASPGQAGDRVLHTPAHGSHVRIPGPDLYPMGLGAERTTPGIWTERDPGYDRAFAKGLQGGY